MSTHPYVSEWRESRLPEWRDTDLADRITLEAPEMRPCNQVAAVPTSTGLLIGCAYRRPMPKPSADAERIQSALLAFVLLSACTGPTAAEALLAAAERLRQSINQRRAERQEAT